MSSAASVASSTTVAGCSTYQSGPVEESIGSPALRAMMPTPTAKPPPASAAPIASRSQRSLGRTAPMRNVDTSAASGRSTTSTPSITKSPGTGRTNQPGEKRRSNPSVRRSGAAIRVTASAPMGSMPYTPSRSGSAFSHVADRSASAVSTSTNTASRPVLATRPRHSAGLSTGNRADSTGAPSSIRRQSTSAASGPANRGCSPVTASKRSASASVAPLNGGPT